MLRKQASDERLYLKREKVKIGLKSLRDTYKETSVACYMVKSTSRWIGAAWRNDQGRECNRCGIGEDDGGRWSEIAL